MQLLDAFRQQARSAAPGDVALLLASVVRMGHVPSYSALDDVLEAPQVRELLSCFLVMLLSISA